MKRTVGAASATIGTTTAARRTPSGNSIVPIYHLAEAMHSQRGTSSAVRARGVIGDAALVAIAVAVALWHPSARWVETNYTNGFYSRLDPVLQAVTRSVPFAVGDALLVAFALLVVGLWIVALARGGRRGVGRASSGCAREPSRCWPSSISGLRAFGG